MLGSLEGGSEVFLGDLTVPVPRRTPDSVQCPSEPLQHLLAQPVAVPRDLATVVIGTVTLNPEQESPGVDRVADPEVDPVTSSSNLRHNVVPPGCQGPQHLGFKRRLGIGQLIADIKVKGRRSLLDVL